MFVMLQIITIKEITCPNVKVPQTAVTTITWKTLTITELLPVVFKEIPIFDIINFHLRFSCYEDDAFNNIDPSRKKLESTKERFVAVVLFPT